MYTVLKRFGNPKKPYFISTIPDGTLLLGDYRDHYSVSLEFYRQEDDLSHFIIDAVKKTDGGYLDIGANVGLLAATVARSLKDREVIAFEAVPETAQRAAATFALNNLDNVRLFPCAVSDQNGEIVFQTAPGMSAQSSIHQVDTDAGKHYDASTRPIAYSDVTVVCRTIDSLMREGHFNQIGLMKIDVEGHEINVVRGSRDLIIRDEPAIIGSGSRSVVTLFAVRPMLLNLANLSDGALSEKRSWACSRQQATTQSSMNTIRE